MERNVVSILAESDTQLHCEEATINMMFMALIWTFIGILLTAATLWRARRVRSPNARAFFRALAIALVFTPFIPHSSVEWSTPWPPAALWLALGFINGDVIQFELFTIAAVTLILWIFQRAIYDRKRHAESELLSP
jgi:cell division protein FtsW (lipid II flippase)